MSKLSTEEKIQILDKLKRAIAPCSEWDSDYPDDLELERKTEQFIEELQNEKKVYEVVFYYTSPKQGNVLAINKFLVRASSKKAATSKAASKTPETYTDVKVSLANILEAD